MNVGQLFVSLGVKGTEKSLQGIGKVKGLLGDTKSAGLETKAAILGAMYALERLFSRSGQAGTDLTNFNAILGVSTQTLQQYQYAARQVGVSNQAVEGSFKGLQATITKTMLGKGAPEGLARVAQIAGGMSASDLNAFADDPAKLLQKLQEYAQKEQNAGLRNEVLRSFGIDDGMIAALTRNAFTPSQLKKAPTYSESEIKSLDKSNIAWANLGNKIEMAVGKFNAKHGGQLVRDIDMVTTSVLKLAEAFMKIAEQFKLFQLVSDVFKGWAAILNGDLSSATSEIAKERYGDDGVMNQMRAMFDVMTGADYDEIDTNKRDSKEQHGAMIDKANQRKNTGINAPWTQEELAAFKAKRNPSPVASNVIPIKPIPTQPQLPANVQPENVAAPRAPAASGPVQSQTVTVKQDLHFQHDGKNAQAVGKDVKKSVQEAFRQMPGLAQGS